MWSLHISIQNKYITITTTKKSLDISGNSDNIALEVLTLGSDHRTHLDLTSKSMTSWNAKNFCHIPERWTHSLWPNTMLKFNDGQNWYY